MSPCPPGSLVRQIAQTFSWLASIAWYSDSESFTLLWYRGKKPGITPDPRVFPEKGVNRFMALSNHAMAISQAALMLALAGMTIMILIGLASRRRRRK
jgi:hypothetical protein